MYSDVWVDACSPVLPHRPFNRRCRSLSPHFVKSIRSLIYMYMHIYVYILISVCMYVYMYV